MVEFGGDADESTSNIALEVMVMQKNKRLQADMTETRNRLQTTTEDLVQLRTKVTQYEQESATHKRLISKLEQDLLNVGTTSSPTASHALPTIPQSPAANQSLLEVITAQRDRLHQRNLELENQLRQLNSTIQTLQSEVDALKDDNVKLYEKIRYVQSYRPQEVRIDAEERYGAMYEEKINPFQAFNKTVGTINVFS
jgi:homeobox protein cut-like